MWFCLHPFFTVIELSLSHSLAQKRATSLPEWLFFVFVSEFPVEGEEEEGGLGEEGEGERTREWQSLCGDKATSPCKSQNVNKQGDKSVRGSK